MYRGRFILWFFTESLQRKTLFWFSIIVRWCRERVAGREQSLFASSISSLKILLFSTENNIETCNSKKHLPPTIPKLFISLNDFYTLPHAKPQLVLVFRLKDVHSIDILRHIRSSAMRRRQSLRIRACFTPPRSSTDKCLSIYRKCVR